VVPTSAYRQKAGCLCHIKDSGGELGDAGVLERGEGGRVWRGIGEELMANISAVARRACRSAP